jgi:hypothetical protein
MDLPRRVFYRHLLVLLVYLGVSGLVYIISEYRQFASLRDVPLVSCFPIHITLFLRIVDR